MHRILNTILDNWDKLDKALRFEKYVPSDGLILPRTEYMLRDGDTVYEILDRAIRHGRIVSCADRISFFAENRYYTTAAARMTRPRFKNAVTVDMAIELCKSNKKLSSERN